MLNSSLRLLGEKCQRSTVQCSTGWCLPRCLENSTVYLDLLHARAIQRPQCCSDPRLFARARRSINEQMGKVTTCSESLEPFGEFRMVAEGIEGARTLVV